MDSVNYTSKRVTVQNDGKYLVKEDTFNISVKPKNSDRLGVMMVGLGGNNGTTLTAGLIAKSKNISWSNKNGEHTVDFLGSISQFGSVHIGYDKNNQPHSKLFKDMSDMYNPEQIVIGGWDICGDNMYKAAKKAGVLDYDLLNKLENDLVHITPLPSIYNPDFIATNQASSANNVIEDKDCLSQLTKIIDDICLFKTKNCLGNVIILWTASTERFHNGKWKTHDELIHAIHTNDPEVSPSILFAVAAAKSNCIFLNKRIQL